MMVRALLGLIALGILMALAVSPRLVSAEQPTPTPVPRMAPPPTRQPAWVTDSTGAETTDQATRGAEVYAAYCITCHGDRGQGLAEWRLTWDPEHQNCSTVNCHGRNHPPEGFYLPDNYAPAIVGTGTLARFRTAQDVYAFISTKMPYQDPGSRSGEQYWALTAFLLRQNGALPPGMEIDEKNAGAIQLHPDLAPAVQPAPPVESSPIVMPVAVGLGAILIAFGAFAWRRRR